MYVQHATFLAILPDFDGLQVTQRGQERSQIVELGQLFDCRRRGREVGRKPGAECRLQPLPSKRQPEHKAAIRKISRNLIP